MEFIGYEEEYKDQSKKRKTGRVEINRKTKVNLVFDPEARRRFLTGFSKRKQARKVQYQEKLDKELVEEKLKMREEAKKSVTKKQSSSHSILPEVEHLLEEDTDSSSSDEEVTETFELGSTIVSISNLTDSLHRKPIKIKTESDEDEEEPDADGSDAFMTFRNRNKPLVTGLDVLKSSKTPEFKPETTKQLKKRLLATAGDSKTETLVKKETNRLLQHSDVYKKALRLKQNRSKKFKLNRLQPGARGGKNTGETAAVETSKPAVGKGKKAAKVKVKTKGK